MDHARNLSGLIAPVFAVLLDVTRAIPCENHALTVAIVVCGTLLVALGYTLDFLKPKRK